MHELAICNALIEQIEAVAAKQCLTNVARIIIRIGPLSGVEPPLLARAFPLVAAGTIGSDAELEIRTGTVQVRCLTCDCQSETTANKLNCNKCGSWQTQLVSGDELILERLEFYSPPRQNSGGLMQCVKPADVQ